MHRRGNLERNPWNLEKRRREATQRRGAQKSLRGGGIRLGIRQIWADGLGRGPERKGGLEKNTKSVKDKTPREEAAWAEKVEEGSKAKESGQRELIPFEVKSMIRCWRKRRRPDWKEYERFFQERK